MNEDGKRILVLDVMGPLPDGAGMIILGNQEKAFPVKCPLADAAACYSHLNGSPLDNPYVFLSSSLLTLSKARLTWVELHEADGHLHALMWYESPELERPIRKSTFNAAEAVNLSLASGMKTINMEKTSWLRAIDSSDALAHLKREFGCLWLWPPLNGTDDLRLLHDYVEEAMPNGSIFR